MTTTPTITDLEQEFEDSFRSFLVDLNKIRNKYTPVLGKDLFDAVITNSSNKIKREMGK